MPGEHEICVIVHDHDERITLDRLLCRAGYRVSEYGKGSALLDDLPTVRASCAIVDVRLPDIDTIAFVAKASRSRPDIAFVIATGSADVPFAMHAMTLGAVDFIEKPVDGETLLQVLRDARRASSRPKRRSIPLCRTSRALSTG